MFCSNVYICCIYLYFINVFVIFVYNFELSPLPFSNINISHSYRWEKCLLKLFFRFKKKINVCVVVFANPLYILDIKKTKLLRSTMFMGIYLYTMGIFAIYNIKFC